LNVLTLIVAKTEKFVCLTDVRWIFGMQTRDVLATEWWRHCNRKQTGQQWANRCDGWTKLWTTAVWQSNYRNGNRTERELHGDNLVPIPIPTPIHLQKIIVYATSLLQISITST